MNGFLYAAVVLIWGTTWSAIYFQHGDVPVTVSVFYRFALAAMIMLPLMKLFGKLQSTQKDDHVFMFFQGACLFSLNFICFYHATQYINTGLASVMFSLATLYNAVNNRLFWKESIPSNVVVAGGIGSTGLVLLFWPEFEGKVVSWDTLKGIGLAALGTYFFSLGNMISKRHSSKGLSPLTTNAYAMCYGTLILATLVFATQQPLVVDTRPTYLAALVYLSIFGSIVAFTMYLTLVARIGANNAAYSTVLYPIVALTLASWFEGYTWQTTSFIGLGLTMLGNVVINLKWRPKWVLSRTA